MLSLFFFFNFIFIACDMSDCVCVEMTPTPKNRLNLFWFSVCLFMIEGRLSYRLRRRGLIQLHVLLNSIYFIPHTLSESLSFSLSVSRYWHSLCVAAVERYTGATEPTPSSFSVFVFQFSTSNDFAFTCFECDRFYAKIEWINFRNRIPRQCYKTVK